MDHGLFVALDGAAGERVLDRAQQVIQRHAFQARWHRHVLRRRRARERAAPFLLQLTEEVDGVAESAVLLQRRRQVGRRLRDALVQVARRWFGARQQRVRLDVHQLRANADELREGIGIEVAGALELLPVLGRDLCQRQCSYVQLFAVDQFQEKVDWPFEAVDLDLHHLTHDRQGEGLLPRGFAQLLSLFIVFRSVLALHGSIIRCLNAGRVAESAPYRFRALV